MRSSTGAFERWRDRRREAKASKRQRKAEKELASQQAEAERRQGAAATYRHEDRRGG